MNQDERRELVGRLAADYEIRIDADDPGLMIVDMCDRVLTKHLAQAQTRPGGSVAAAEAMAQATATALSSKVVPQLQAAVSTEVQRVVARLRPPATIWSNPAFVGVVCTLLGVIVGVLLRRIA